MKRSLIVLALSALAANVAFAQPTLTGDDTYNQVHLIGWKNAPEATSFSGSESRAMEQSAEAQMAPYGQSGIYSFNP